MHKGAKLLGFMPNRPLAYFAMVVTVALLVVVGIDLCTNRMPPRWDMDRYLDMARNGISGNKKLVAPYAYIPGAPLLIGALARVFSLDTGWTFRAAGCLMSVGFVVFCFYFARWIGASVRSALFASVVTSLYFYIVKWPFFAGTMVDIYAYPIILVAFWAALRGRFYLCVIISGIGLLFREFLLLPLLAQAASIAQAYYRTNRRKIIPVFAATGLALCLFLILPRVLIHVASSVWDIDPIHDPSSLWNFIWFPASKKRDFNILFAYFSFWLPVLLLMNRQRLLLVWDRVQPYRSLLIWYMVFHFGLVMWGGMNLCIFATYSLPVLLIVLTVLLDEGSVQGFEMAFVVLAVLVFNRILWRIPDPQLQMPEYLEYYGGFHKLVTQRSIWRFAELSGWVAGLWTIRALITQTSSSREAVGTCNVRSL